MGWEDIHLHHFLIHGKQYGVTQPGGTAFSDCVREVKLATFGWQLQEKFFYEYDFSTCPSMGTWRYWWRHQIRLEARSAVEANQTYPVCTGGKGVCPPEDCGGAWGFMEARQKYSGWYLLERFSSMLEEGDWEEYREELCQLRPWLLVERNHFDRDEVNRRLQQYASGDKELMLCEQRIG